MGDWAITTYWGDNHPPDLPAVWDPDCAARAARVGRLGDTGLWQFDVLQKYGWFTLDPDEDPYLFGMAATYNHLSVRTGGPLLAGWNYLLTRSEEPIPPGLLPTAIELWGEPAVLLDDGGDQRGGRALLCLPEPFRCADSFVTFDLADSQYDPTPEARFIEALALAAEPVMADWPRAPDTAWSRELGLGLWTAELGYLHTGTLRLYIDPELVPPSAADRSLSGADNELTDESTAGPWGPSLYFEFAPVPLPNVPWPFPP
jgi:hypothetical protein